MKQYIVIEKIDVQNANAWNNIVVGFPAITGFLGATHALERNLNAAGVACNIGGTAIMLHEYELKSVIIPKKGWENTLLTIPLPSSIPGKNEKKIKQHLMNQAYIDMLVSIVIEVNVDDKLSIKNLCNLIKKKFNKLRIAGGMICSFGEVKQIQDIKKLPNGYILIDRSSMLTKSDGSDMSEKMFNILQDNKEIIPIVIGYKALSDLGHVNGQRDTSKLHRFVESIFGLGEFCPLKEIADFNQVMWSYFYHNGIYRCIQKN